MERLTTSEPGSKRDDQINIFVYFPLDFRRLLYTTEVLIPHFRKNIL